MARLSQGTKHIECCLAYLPQAVVGDYVLVQHGFAVELLDPAAAAASLAAFAQLGLTDLDQGPATVLVDLDPPGLV
jgi:hydrogenase expression/formation protein HypC